MTQAGFWRNTQPTNQRITVGSYGALNNVWYIFPQGGAPTIGAPRNNVFTSFESLRPNLRSRDLIILGGVLREQAVAPSGVYEVSIVGAAGIPRQATDGGVPTGGGATWMAPASGAAAATPLLEIVRQGWSIENVLFNPHTSSAAVRLTTSGGLNEAGQFAMRNCTVLGGGTGQIGVEDNGGSGFVVVEDCLFQLLTGTALLGLSTSNAVPLSWQILRSQFRANTNDIKMSLSYALIQWNRFFTAGSGATNKVISTTALAGQGGNNLVIDNQFNNTEAQIAPGSGFTGAASDVWRNFVTDGTWYAIGQPA